MNTDALSSQSRLAVVVFVLLFGIILLRTAWVSEDAYITFRTVDNFVNGYGLRWNTAERVQAFTNPLWMFLVSFVYLFTHEVYYSSLFLSFAVSLAAVVVYSRRIARSSMSALTGITILLFSKAFMDYSTSGLENPLTHLLLAVFLSLHYQPDLGRRRIFLLSLVAAAGALNRMDTILFFIPAVAYALATNRAFRRPLPVLAGFAPFLLWEAFSLLYYGFLFPNTAYGKLATGIPRVELAEQGVYYFLNSLETDPLTILVIAAALILPFLRKQWEDLPPTMGLALYLVYILSIGGDFMSGRFFAAPLFCAVMVVARTGFRSWRSTLPAMGVTFLVGLLSSQPPPLSDGDYGPRAVGRRDDNRIADERAIYYRSSGLLRARRDIEMPNHSFAFEGRRLRAQGPSIVERAGIGLLGFYAGPKVHIVDIYGLADPLLARLPSRINPGWRIGHFVRVVPEGYLSSLAAEENRFRDTNLGDFYEKIRVITRGELFSWTRWLTIWNMNTGSYDHLIDYDNYRYPAMIRLKLSGLAGSIAPRGGEGDSGGLALTHSGMEITLEGRSRQRALEISVDRNDDYRIVYLRDKMEIARQMVRRLAADDDGLTTHMLVVPEEAMNEGYDTIRVFPVAGERPYLVGHVRLLP